MQGGGGGSKRGHEGGGGGGRRRRFGFGQEIVKDGSGQQHFGIKVGGM